MIFLLKQRADKFTSWSSYELIYEFLPNMIDKLSYVCLESMVSIPGEFHSLEFGLFGLIDMISTLWNKF